MREKQKLDRRDAHTHGKLILIKGGEKKMDISTKKVRIVRYGRELRITTQFLPTLLHGVFSEGAR
ncbi:MAG: hypothetical protein M1462_06720 [Candidatus Thermoplasmatota archaeon]|jgi:hypothetical protein|nr:hypothetical protein [Candidatus Thermoplasmatota archaeon]